MNISTKLLQAAAGQAGGAGLDIDEVFSTYLYEGTGSAQTITNSIDLSGEGGLVWIKNRDTAYAPMLFDTARGLPSLLYSSATSAADTTSGLATGTVTAFNSNGFTLGSEPAANTNGESHVSWTFRKSPMFDIVTYTGNGTTGTSSDTPQTISHNLGSVPGMIIVKKTSGTSGWFTFHRSTGSSKYLRLNATSAASNSTDGGAWGTYDPTSTDFKVGYLANDNGATYVAYLFAHNNSDGGFGPDADQDVIKCGSYTGNASGTGPEINLGFEPQWLLVKNADNSSADWLLLDVMRGWGMGDADIFLEPNSSGADQGSQNWVDITSTGFKITNANGQINGLNQNHIYMAISRGPLAAPTDATKVFAVQDGRGASKLYTAGFPVDMFLQGNKNGDNWQLHSRLTRGKVLATDTTAAETDDTFYYFDDQTGIVTSSGGGSALTQLVAYMWKRAPSYFDVVTYTGNNTSRSINHNLTVSPEMIWIKQRDGTREWFVFHKDLTSGNGLRLNSTTGEEGGPWESMTSTTFGINNGSDVNLNNKNFIAYLFATVAGVSKVGSFTGSDSDQTIDCGFSSGARFVLLKCTTDTNNWAVWDTARGIVSGNEPYLVLDRSDAEITGQDRIDPHSSGFTVAGNFTTGNDAGQSYIFYAIA